MADRVVFPEDVINHMFKCNTDYFENGSLIIRHDEGGIITDYSPALGKIKCNIWTRAGRPRCVVPLKHITVGAKNTGKYEVTRTAPHITQLSLQPPLLSAPGPGDLRNHFSAFLTGVWEAREKLPQLQTRHRYWLENPDKIRGTCHRIQESIRKCSPKLLDVLARDDFTLKDVMNACKTVRGDNVSAGCYLRVYSDFDPESEWADYDPFGYDGQTNNQSRRNREHQRNSLQEKFKYSHHYQIMNAARKVEVFQLCQHDENEGGSALNGKGMRDITEQLLMVMLRLYSTKALSMKDKIDQVGEAEEQLSDRGLSALFNEIGTLSFKQTGFADPWQPGRKVPFGSGGGANFKSPLGGDQGEAYEKVPWSVTDQPDMWIFHRSSMVLGSDRRVFATDFKENRGNFDNINVAMDAGPEGMTPQVGDTFWIQFEVMKPGKGEHPVPFFRNATIGAYENWEYANMIAFKIFWKSKATGKFYVKYWQRNVPKPLYVPGHYKNCHRRYALGVALYAYFVRSEWPNKPACVPSFGYANLAMVEVNHLRQQVNINVLTRSLAILKGPKEDLRPVIELMKAAGLHNVNGPWQSLDHSYVDDPNTYENGVLPNGMVRAGLRQRRSCDACAIYIEAVSSASECSRVGDSNRCQECVLRGLPCSWTPTPIIFGNDWYKFKKGTRKHPSLDRYVDLLIKKLETEEAGKAKEIPNPGFMSSDGAWEDDEEEN